MSSQLITLCFLSVFFPDRAHDDFGLTKSQSAILITVLGVTHLLARPLLGLLGTKDSSINRKQIVYGSASLLKAGACLISIWFDSMGTQVVFVITFGIAAGN